MTSEREQAPFAGNAFSNVDASGNAAMARRHLELMSAEEQVRELWAMAIDLMRVESGSCVLDVGCGLGDMAFGLEHVVGKGGRAVGIDFSREMLKTANERSRSIQASVALALADAGALPLRSGSFDGCYAERVLEHVLSPASVLSEMARVAKAGARVVVVEPDWGTYALDLPDSDVTRRVRDFLEQEGHRNGWIGRQLPTLFSEAGLDEVTVKAWNMLSFGELAAVEGDVRWTRGALKSGRISAEEAAEHERLLDDAVGSGRYFRSLTFLVVAGTRP